MNSREKAAAMAAKNGYKTDRVSIKPDGMPRVSAPPSNKVPQRPAPMGLPASAAAPLARGGRVK